MKYKRNKESDIKYIRFMYMITMLLLQIISIYIIKFGVHVHLYYNKYAVFNKYKLFTGDLTSASLSVLMNVYLLLASTVGIFGALKKNELLITMSAGGSWTVLGVNIVCIAITKLVSTGNTLWKQILIPVKNIIAGSTILEQVDFIQNSLQCCGSKDYTDYIDVEFPKNMSTITVSKNIGDDVVFMELPVSCCMDRNEECVIWSEGCKQVLFDSLVHYESSIGDLALLSALVIILGTVLYIPLREEYYVPEKPRIMSGHTRKIEQTQFTDIESSSHKYYKF